MVCEKNVASESVQNGIPCVTVSNVELLDVSRVFDCGQSFRFDRVTDSAHSSEFGGCAYGKYISVAQDGTSVYIYNVTLDEYNATWKRYLGLDRDYAEINNDILSLSQQPALARAVEYSSGIRILRQEPWEAICSFIISQNNNIPRIKKLVAALCRECGEKIDVSGMQGHIADAHRENIGNFYSFPSAEAVAELGVDGLFALKTGFRAKYIYDAAQKMINGDIDISLLEQSPSTAECTEHLCRVKGIGPKVASCALLFGFGHLDAFPVDVWIKRATEKYFGTDFEPSSLGKYAGVAQQYLFYYERYVEAGKGENLK